MKHARICTTLFLFLLAIAAAPATAGQFTVGGNIGVSLPIADFDDVADKDLVYHGYLTVPVFGALALRGEVGHHEVSLDGDLQAVCEEFLGATCDASLEFTNLSGGLQYGGAPEGGLLGLSNLRLQPYAFVMLGSYKAKGEIGQIGPIPTTLSQDERFFGLSLGGGLNIRIGERWGVEGDLHLHSIRFDESERDPTRWQHFIAPSFGVWIAF